MPSPTSHQTDMFAGAVPGVSPVGAADVSADVRALGQTLPANLRLGTSSWSFPGWAGLVYDRSATKTALARDGLPAYGAHPLFRTVGVDRGYYRPLGRGVLESFRAAVPPGFRFLVKAPRDLVFPTLGPPGQPGASNPGFLDVDLAVHDFVEPVTEALRDRTGPLVFQFPPMDPVLARRGAGFAERLHRFLQALPPGPLYAVELRNAELLVPEYGEALRAAGAVHCLNVHPSMPPIGVQRDRVGPDLCEPLVVRWMLGHGQGYAAARDRYSPFDRLVDEDVRTRDEVGRACVEAARGKGAFVIVNNKAEGSSPLSVVKLAEWIVSAGAG